MRPLKFFFEIGQRLGGAQSRQNFTTHQFIEKIKNRPNLLNFFKFYREFYSEQLQTWEFSSKLHIFRVIAVSNIEKCHSELYGSENWEK